MQLIKARFGLARENAWLGRAMKESVTYQAIRAKGEAIGEANGRVEGEQNVLLRQGKKRFGEPDTLTSQAIRAIASSERLEQLSEKILEVESWVELLRLAGP